MKTTTTKAITTILITFLLACLIVLPGNTFAQSSNGQKVGDDLDKIKKNSPQTASVNVIFSLNSAPSGQLNSFLNRSGVRLRSNYKYFNNLMAITLPAGKVDELSNFPEVEYVSFDGEYRASGHVSMTTGANDARSQTVSSAFPNGVDGTGIGIAIIDSGIDPKHSLLNDVTGKFSRLVASVDFTGENRVDDPYGHGTHVAAVAAGSGELKLGAYMGMAPNAKIINLRVLNRYGTGSASALVAALDWVMTNRATYNIRVINMSLGGFAVNSYKNDPVCLAVRRLVDVGIVAVAAAGNNGKSGTGQKQYGAIHSPGNEPSAITVGASNGVGTDARNDDVVTTYSSRGPTRSFRTDALGIKHYDNLIKPDLVAPGNRLIYAQSANNLIVTQNPGLAATPSLDIDERQMYLSGSSMSAPEVAGAAVLLLHANPSLKPNMIKAILMFTAQQLAGYNTLEQGAGQLNIEGAMRLAKLVRTDLSSTTAVGAPLLTTATFPIPQTTIGTYTFPWSQGLVAGNSFAYGTNLMKKYQKVYGLGVLISDGILLNSSGVLISDGTKMSDGVLISDRIVKSNGVLISDGTTFMSTGVLLADGVLISDGVLLSDGVLISDSLILGNGVLLSDAQIQAQQAEIQGDNTPSMLPAP